MIYGLKIGIEERKELRLTYLKRCGPAWSDKPKYPTSPGGDPKLTNIVIADASLLDRKITLSMAEDVFL